MAKKYVLMTIVLLAMLLSACQMDASTPPPAAPNNENPQASPTADTIMEDIARFGTQTAEAAGTPSEDPLAPLDGDATATPLAGLEQPTVDPFAPTPTGDFAVMPTVTPQVIIPQPTVETVRPATYVLQQGEFIFCLARRFNVDVEETLALNGIYDSETLYPGLTVKIPSTGSFSGNRALKAHPATYTVQSTKETIYSVACQYGDVDPLNIAAVNGLAAPYTLTVGAQLNIP